LSDQSPAKGLLKDFFATVVSESDIVLSAKMKGYVLNVLNQYETSFKRFKYL